jgi:hypothetical protein
VFGVEVERVAVSGLTEASAIHRRHIDGARGEYDVGVLGVLGVYGAFAVTTASFWFGHGGARLAPGACSDRHAWADGGQPTATNSYGRYGSPRYSHSTQLARSLVREQLEELRERQQEAAGDKDARYQGRNPDRRVRRQSKTVRRGQKKKKVMIVTMVFPISGPTLASLDGSWNTEPTVALHDAGIG